MNTNMSQTMLDISAKKIIIIPSQNIDKNNLVENIKDKKRNILLFKKV